ncbi:MAG: hypothetical protein FWH22_11230 [Fibromonadales bacterium]|nr:hypothetical protein [Fibromonadales bacterium]
MRKQLCIGGGKGFTIKTKHRYLVIELYELLESNIDKKFLPLKIKESVFEEIIARGVNGYTNHITFSNIFGQNLIMISQENGSGLGSFIARFIEFFGGIIDFRGRKGNQKLMKELAEKIETLVNN